MTPLVVHSFIACRDNYGYLVHDPETGETASIDAPDADAIRRELCIKGWRLSQILITHHDWDHVQGNRALKKHFNCTITGPAREAHKIPDINRDVNEGHEIAIGRHRLTVMETPGHTLGHVCYWSAALGAVFVGDTVFTIGCGRVREGTPEMMWTSLSRLALLPLSTTIFVGHDYAEANARFAIAVDPDNVALQRRIEDIGTRGSRNPTLLSEELATNPFFRADSMEIRAKLDLQEAPTWQVFANLRARKDRF